MIETKRTPFELDGLTPADVIGVDPSPTNTAVAVMHGGVLEVAKLSPPASIGTGLERLLWFSRTWTDFLFRFPGLPVCIEHYSFGSKFTRAHSTGEVGGVLRLEPYRAGRCVVEVAPTSVKKFATGEGTAKKSMMMKYLFKRWSVDIDDEDIADAVAIALYYVYGVSLIAGDQRDTTVAMRDALKKDIKKGTFDGQRMVRRIRAKNLQLVSNVA